MKRSKFEKGTECQGQVYISNYYNLTHISQNSQLIIFKLKLNKQ